MQESEGRLRPICTDCGFTFYLDPKLAVTVVIEREGNVLLGLRGEGTREPGKWSFPAGFVDRGERVEAAAAREVREETGLELGAMNLLDLISSDGEAVVLAVYVADSFVGEPAPFDDLAAVAWFDPHDLPELAFPHDHGIVKAWLEWREKTFSYDNS
jgi:ADP-ribose pyrophosphatase YjhB (NUDIX family)